MNSKEIIMDAEKEIHIDCFQNILIYIVRKHVQGFIPGGVWPWKFSLFKDNGILEIENNDIVSLKLLEYIGNIFYEYRYLPDDQDKLEYVLQLLEKKEYVVLGVDQYYVPYHKRTIYLKKHGKHTLLLESEYDKEKVRCLSFIPNYEGNIDLKTLNKALNSDYVKSWIIDFRFPINNIHISTKRMLDFFWNSFENQMSLDEFGKRKEIISTRELNKIFLELRIKNRLHIFIANEWGWNMSNRSNGLCYFLSKIVGQNDFLTNISEMGRSLDNNWDLLFKRIFLKVLSNDNTGWEKIDFLFYKVIEQEDELKECIMSMKDYLYKKV